MEGDQDACDCRTAVIRTFGELRRRNVSPMAARDSAISVFRFHHPEIPETEAKKTVDKWVAN